MKITELADITEAKYAGHTPMYVVVEVSEHGWSAAYGPFNTEKQANQYIAALVKQFDLEEEQADEYSVTRVLEPEL